MNGVHPFSGNLCQGALKLCWRLVVDQHVTKTVDVFVFFQPSVSAVEVTGSESTKCDFARPAKRAVLNRHSS